MTTLDDALVKFVAAVKNEVGLSIFGDEFRSLGTATLAKTMEGDLLQTGAVFRQTIDDRTHINLTSGVAAFELVNGLVHQFFVDPKKSELVGDIKTAATNSRLLFERSGEAAIKSYSIATCALILAYMQGSKGGGTLKPAKTIATDSAQYIRAIHDRLQAWSPTRFSKILFRSIYSKGEIVGTEYCYTFDGQQADREYGSEARDRAAYQRIELRLNSHVQADWNKLLAELQL